jgi:hypothetical protein
VPRFRVPRFHAELDFSLLDDEDRHLLVRNIQDAAPKSPLFLGSPALQASLADLVAKDAVLGQANTTLDTDRLKVRLDIAAEATARSELDAATHTFVAMVEQDAKAPADIEGVGLCARPRLQRQTLAPEPPVQIDATFPRRGHGKAMVTVYETGGVRRQYVAEQSPDPIGDGTWTPLGLGRGKTRTVTGPSGSRVWVRFATVRGELMSAWSTPILVTLP